MPMSPRPDEIDCLRLLTYCEKSLENGNIDLWTDTDKRKFTSYVEHLGKKRMVGRECSMGTLTDAITQYDMKLKVQNGVDEARMTKKLLLDRLKELHGPDTEWLANRPNEETVSPMPDEGQQSDNDQQSDNGQQEEVHTNVSSAAHSSDEGDTISNKQDTKNGPEPRQTWKQSSASENRASLLRSRRHRQPSDVEEDTRTAERVLKHSRELHEELKNDLLHSVTQLKDSVFNFGDLLAKDKSVTKGAEEAQTSSISKMQRERQRLDEHYSKSWGTSLLTFGTIFFVCIVFVLAFLTIRFLPKA